MLNDKPLISPGIYVNHISPRKAEQGPSFRKIA